MFVLNIIYKYSFSVIERIKDFKIIGNDDFKKNINIFFN